MQSFCSVQLRSLPSTFKCGISISSSLFFFGHVSYFTLAKRFLMTMDSCKARKGSLLDVWGFSQGSLKSHYKEDMSRSVGRQKRGLSFILKMFIKGQLCARYCSWCWEAIVNKTSDLCPHRGYNLVGIFHEAERVVTQRDIKTRS